MPPIHNSHDFHSFDIQETPVHRNGFPGDPREIVR